MTRRIKAKENTEKETIGIKKKMQIGRLISFSVKQGHGADRVLEIAYLAWNIRDSLVVSSRDHSLVSKHNRMFIMQTKEKKKF